MECSINPTNTSYTNHALKLGLYPITTLINKEKNIVSFHKINIPILWRNVVYHLHRHRLNMIIISEVKANQKDKDQNGKCQKKRKLIPAIKHGRIFSFRD